MGKEQTLLLELTKSELAVYDYIKQEAEKREDRTISLGTREIGRHIDLSEATVQRAIKKLQKHGVIGIIPAPERGKPNSIVYYGIPDETQEVEDIFGMVSQLNSSVNRFRHILESKNSEIIKLQAKLKESEYEINKLQEQLRDAYHLIESMQTIISSYESGNRLLKDAKVVSIQETGEGMMALIFKKTKE
jgi:predicted transcriptional regulator